MFRAITAGALYAIIIFVIGFILDTIRVLLIVPRLDETAAVILEVPFMLAASWFVWRSSRHSGWKPRTSTKYRTLRSRSGTARTKA